MPHVRKTFFAFLGSTTPEVALQLALEAPHFSHSTTQATRWVVIDSQPYDDMVSRFHQQGWPVELIRRAIPPGAYFFLRAPFGEHVDFTDPRYVEFQDILFEPALQRFAREPDAPGCAGVPALARFRAVGNRDRLIGFFKEHIHELELVGASSTPGNARPGIHAELLTTFHGATGTGGTLTVGASLRSVLPAKSILNLKVIMPSTYERRDEQAIANAVAQLREQQHVHSEGGLV